MELDASNSTKLLNLGGQQHQWRQRELATVPVSESWQGGAEVVDGEMHGPGRTNGGTAWPHYRDSGADISRQTDCARGFDFLDSSNSAGVLTTEANLTTRVRSVSARKGPITTIILLMELPRFNLLAHVADPVC